MNRAEWDAISSYQKDKDISSELRTNREIRESAMINPESRKEAIELLQSARDNLSVVLLNAFPSDKRKEASKRTIKAIETIDELLKLFPTGRG